MLVFPIETAVTVWIMVYKTSLCSVFCMVTTLSLLIEVTSYLRVVTEFLSLPFEVLAGFDLLGGSASAEFCSRCPADTTSAAVRFSFGNGPGQVTVVVRLGRVAGAAPLATPGGEGGDGLTRCAAEGLSLRTGP